MTQIDDLNVNNFISKVRMTIAMPLEAVWGLGASPQHLFFIIFLNPSFKLLFIFRYLNDLFLK